MKNPRIFGLAVYVMVISVFATTSCWANGKNGHDHGHGNSPHMQAMYALKDKIPTDYQIMERTPIIPDQESVQSGSVIFQRQCAACHGEHGRGDGPSAKHLNLQPANFFDLEHSAFYGPGEKFWIIGNGSGETGMPAFPNLSLVERWDLVNHIYHLQGGESVQEQHEHHH